jgi:TRAF3-interacting protein 1
MYEQLFAKPKMSEKLLCKPPFRYLHDIFTATMEKTGFGNGLFQGSELNSKGFDDKESKTAFLVKLITLTEMMIGEKIEIKPSMILAGQQPDKTNLWLQQMFRAATAGVDSTPYVQQILGIGGEEENNNEAEEQLRAEEEARAQAEAEEEEARQRAEMEKAEKKRRAEEKKRRQKQAEEEERQRLEYERMEQERLQQIQQEQAMQEMQM